MLRAFLEMMEAKVLTSFTGLHTFHIASYFAAVRFEVVGLEDAK
jgi:hypothetical protein